MPGFYFSTMSKFLIAGLGNPGAEYENTRHNAGYAVLDHWMKAEKLSFEPGRLASVCQLKFKGKIFVLIKPTTFMNLSGKAVNYWLQAEKISVHNLLVVTDDIAFPFGVLRLKGKGSDGGHNGLKDIVAVLNTTEFARLRFGIGDEFSKGKQTDHVLGEWGEEDKKTLEERLSLGVEIIKSFGSIGLERTMSAFNKK